MNGNITLKPKKINQARNQWNRKITGQSPL